MERIHFRFKKANANSIRYRKFKFIITDLAQLSILFAVIGFFNIWLYLSRINKLSLLTAVLSTPSTLLAVFASICLILIKWGVLLSIPSIIMTWSTKINKIERSVKRLLYHSLCLSIALAILGCFPAENAIPMIIYYIMFYCCYIVYLHTVPKENNSFAILLTALLINIGIIFIFSVLYNSLSLHQYSRPERVFALLIGMLIIYMPIFIIAWHITNKKKIKLKEVIVIAVLSVCVLVYLIAIFASGIFIKLNDYSMNYAGLRGNSYHWIKINPDDFPDNWLNNYKGVKQTTKNGSVWIEGLSLFQNKDYAFVCSQETIEEMNKYTRSRMILFFDNPAGSMDTNSCILTENKPTNHIQKEKINPSNPPLSIRQL